MTKQIFYKFISVLVDISISGSPARRCRRGRGRQARPFGGLWRQDSRGSSLGSRGWELGSGSSLPVLQAVGRALMLSDGLLVDVLSPAQLAGDAL